MASEGLLGFIKGVSGTLEEEYKRQNVEASTIREEGRAEERAIRAEQRRILAEKQAAEYRKKLDLQYKPQELQVVTDFETSLLERGKDPALMRSRMETEQEVELINRGKDPASARKEYDDRSEADRIRAGQDSETARLNAGTDAAKTKAAEKARLEAQREDDKIRAEEGLPAKGKQDVNVSFTLSEATSQLKSDLSANHGIDIGGVRTRMNDPMQGSRMAELRDGSTSLAEILKDPASKAQLREEVAFKLHNATEKRLKEAAKAKDITSLDQVTPLSDLIAERADQTMAALDKAQQMVAKGEFTAETSGQLRDEMAKAYGEPDEESKQSTAFRSMWAAFNKALTK